MEFIAGIFSLIFMVFCAIVWFIPIILIAGSSKTGGKEKLAWILAVIFISWFAWIFYLLLAPLGSKEVYYR
ncbi:hypothetical protein DRW07_08670 [Alteromonas sediminis]|uniref:Cardiolipin synthase N-terminal domain-containing protein n=1 Tax=Alteromonas sediminis TaxID=2259342 RepID=A0A3N5Y3W1_9ALTE|nr:hypothetical protein [Alteromonas sediminis]RPJ67576.1 hypothetical protein DRW07_08670 [Alteromonas sediminis]